MVVSARCPQRNARTLQLLTKRFIRCVLYLHIVSSWASSAASEGEIHLKGCCDVASRMDVNLILMEIIAAAVLCSRPHEFRIRYSMPLSVQGASVFDRGI